ncbi:hypothetical protein [Rubrivirga marina]|uniref:Zinc-finger domain-containing protein n=1 Tax=Rubrivirga marina TaxID=1196024 RepID=A0A271J422_9BACT|nr:hypothetical protein [Rubrivirga marina]PAP78193.1 hypothetical protein BSZ37_18045 [Rubrivirga marina]
MTLTPDVLRLLVAKALASRPDEMSCGECDARLDRFAEISLAGRDAADALPLVEEHLEGCPGCREEFEALMDVLRAAEREGQPWWRRLLARRG